MTTPDYLPEQSEDAKKAAEVKRHKLREARRSLGVSSLDAALITHRPAPEFSDPAALLEFERTHPDSRAAGTKEAEIRDHFHVRAARYYSRLYQLIHDDEVTARRLDPQTVNRLLRAEAEHEEHRRELLRGVTEA